MTAMVSAEEAKRAIDDVHATAQEQIRILDIRIASLEARIAELITERDAALGVES